MTLFALKHEDTRRIFTLAGLLLAAAVLLALFARPWLVPAVLILVFLVLALLVAHYYRAGQEDRIWQIQDIQDLQFIQSTLDLVRPLPYFTRWSSSPALAARLISIVRQHKPQRILELGSGVSTVVMAYASRDASAGSIVSLDHDPEYAAITRRELAAHGLSDRATVHDAPLVTVQTSRGARTWYDLSAIEGMQDIDLLIVDGPPRKTGPDSRWPAFDQLHDRMAPGAVVVLDDTARDDESESRQAWLTLAREHGAQQIPSQKGVTILQLPG